MASAVPALEKQPEADFERIAETADHCPGYGMCRIDFLGTGVCPVGKRMRFAAYYPQGRMQAISAYRRGLIPLTRKLFEIALACDECGSCDKQCYFTAGLRTLPMLRAFKEHARQRRSQCVDAPHGPLWSGLADIVGAPWCSDDPAVLAGYARARSPLAGESPPAYVALPGTAEETASLVRFCRRHDLPFVPRGAATSLGGALTRGLVIDMARMDRIRIDTRRWCATVEPGVHAFDLQKEAARYNMRANVAEPAACVCANVICTNMHSFFSYSYGAGADHYIDAQFVGPEGEIYRLSQDGAPNPFFVRGAQRLSLGICTEMDVKLHPVCPDEEAVLVPCGSLAEAVEVARQIARRRIGAGLGVIGTLYLSMFAAPTADAAPRIREILEKKLGIGALVLALGERNSLASINTFAAPAVDQRLASMLLRALPGLEREPGFQMLTERAEGQALYKEIFSPDLQPLLEMALRTSARAAQENVDEDMRGFFAEFQARPESSDPVWLNSFRILSARMGRGRQFVSRILYYSLEDAEPLVRACSELGRLGDTHGLRHGFGYLVPFPDGTRAVMEYDYYYDRTDAREVRSMQRLMEESARLVSSLRSDPGLVCSSDVVLMQGLCRPETYLFGR